MKERKHISLDGAKPYEADNRKRDQNHDPHKNSSYMMGLLMDFIKKFHNLNIISFISSTGNDLAFIFRVSTSSGFSPISFKNFCGPSRSMFKPETL